MSETFELNLAEFIDVKGLKAMGNRLSSHQVTKVRLLEFGEEPTAPGGGNPSPDASSGPSGKPDTPGSSNPKDRAKGSDNQVAPVNESAAPVKTIGLEITNPGDRSEERRVGKECVSRGRTGG